MLEYTNEPPSKRALKQYFLDANRKSFSQDTLNCAAHMILVLEEPDEVIQVGLEHIVQKLEACRADMGFLKPHDRSYRPKVVYYNDQNEPPDCDGVSYPNQVRVFQQAWHQRTPVTCDSVNSSPLLGDTRKKFESIQSKSILFQRLTLNREPVGITCVDFTHDEHVWTPEEIHFVESFAETFLGPLAGISRYWHDPNRSQIIRKPTKSELMAIELAAKGMSYKQIAAELGKSIRTIENQLRSARYTLNATNQAELISKCELWL